MKTITVQVHDDHLETLSRTKPMNAMAELMWNALDAEATELRVEFEDNELNGTEVVRVIDNGHGLDYEEALVVFQNLGGSWKKEGMRTPGKGRVLHGKHGKGRFRAFTLGNKVTWTTVFDMEGRKRFSIAGNAETLGEFSVSSPAAAGNRRTGMMVEIEAPAPNVELLRGTKALEEVTDIFALYLRQYPDVKIFYDGVPVDPSHVEIRYTPYVLEEMVMQNGERVAAELTVVEWNLPGKRGVFLCDEHGFMLHHVLPRLHFRGFSYTAYLKSAHLSVLDGEGLLQTGELSADLRQMLDVVRGKLREHFTLREAEDAQDILAEWKEAGIYPYTDVPRDDAEANERRIFDIYSTHLNQIFPDFVASRPRNKRLTLRLIQELVHTQPTRIARILDELLEFPEEKEEEILELVQR